MPIYRVYNKENVYLRETKARNYDHAISKLKPETSDKVFCVENDGHEILCGAEYIADMLDSIFDDE